MIARLDGASRSADRRTGVISSKSRARCSSNAFNRTSSGPSGTSSWNSGPTTSQFRTMAASQSDSTSSK